MSDSDLHDKFAVEAARRVVAAKTRLDEARVSSGKNLVLPDAFVQYAFPYADGGQGRQAEVSAVNPDLVIDAPWNPVWKSPPVGDDALRLCEELDRLAHSKEVANWAILVQVGELPLWYALEGKNRIAMYRSLRRPVVAEVRRSRHPSCSDLVVRRGRGVAGVHRVAIPQVVMPLPVGEVADFLLAMGAGVGAPLTEDEIVALQENAATRSLILDTFW